MPSIDDSYSYLGDYVEYSKYYSGSTETHMYSVTTFRKDFDTVRRPKMYTRTKKQTYDARADVKINFDNPFAGHRFKVGGSKK